MSESSQRWLSELYRASSREEPPASLDSAILGEARKVARNPASVASSWGVPIAAAAVIALSVALVITVYEDLADTQDPRVLYDKKEERVSEVVVPKRIEKPEPMAREDQQPLQLSSLGQGQGDAKQAEGIAKADREAPAALVGDKSSQGLASSPVPSPEPSERGAFASAAPSPPASPAPALETREQAPAQPAAGPPAAAKAELVVPGAVTEQRRARSAAESDQAVPQAKQAIAANDVPRRLESFVDDRIAPEAWLERIAKLRDEGRHAEARESLAAFKKRYPDHPLPDALRSY